MRYVGWDTETDRIGINAIVPDLICSTWYDLATGANEIRHWSPRDAHAAVLLRDFSDPNCHIVGHNTAYDTLVACKYDINLFDAVWEAYYADRIHDTMIREMLLNLATYGSIDTVTQNGSTKQIGYSLAALVMQYLNEDISADKDDDESVRVNYSMVKDIPLSEWPEEFITYALADPRYTGKVFLEQEIRRQRILKERGFDPLKVEGFRARAHFALGIMTAQGNLLDGERVLKATREFTEMYNDPRLVQPLVKAGIVVPALPPQPHKGGQKEHLPTCTGHKDHKDYRKGKTVKDCDCPIKMTMAQPEKESVKTLHQYVWDLARRNDTVQAWASEGLVESLRLEGLSDKYLLSGKVIDQSAVRAAVEKEIAEAHATGVSPDSLPDGWRLAVDEEWRASFAVLDPLMELYAERKRIQKIVTSYLPCLYWAEGYDQCPHILEGKEGRLDGKVPATRVHSGFTPLKKTGRCSSRAATKGKGAKALLLYPSWNGQQVDPRTRECVIPEPGNVLFSIDYSAMELGTLAQTCINLFGHSVLADKINAGEDVHAYLGAQIAYELDPWFRGMCGSESMDQRARRFVTFKKAQGPCESPTFPSVYRKAHKDAPEDKIVLFSDFFDHYRKFAKPTDLGYPGGLGPKTFIAYAKATYGVDVDLPTAELLREVWKQAFPEMPEYLNHINKGCEDVNAEPDWVETEDGVFEKRRWYAYTTPFGMHRARCSYTSCANGKGLQSPSAEGALSGLCDVMRDVTIGPLAGFVFPSIFIHDEIFGEIEWYGPLTTKWIEMMQETMVRNMRRITPDVRAGTEACLMLRWSKNAKPVFETDGDGNKYLVPWKE